MDTETTYKGAMIDTRPEEAKAKDYRFEEIVASAAPVNWTEKKEKDWRKFPIFDQDGSGSCVAQTAKKMLGVYMSLNTNGQFLPLSASHIYKRRVNKPDGGMIADDCFKIMQKGTTLAQFAPDEKMNDSKMDAVEVNAFEEKIGEAFKIGNYFTIAPKDIDTIASIIQETGKAVMVWFYFKHDEWGEVPAVKYPTLDLYGASTSRHSVAAVDFTLYKGKKALIIDDSWGPNAGNGAGQRIITEDFFNARNWFAAHFMNFKFEDQNASPTPSPTPTPGKPKYNFGKDLEYIPSAPIVYNQPDVVALQNCLKWEGCFPANSQSTGYFGSVTKASVGKFQVKYGIAGPADAGFGRCGPKTRAKLNALFA